jgi:hypothetical protein
MGFLGLFGGGGGMSQGRIDKSAKLAANPFAQPDVRMREMQRLLQEGSPAALRGLLKRFTANASGGIADEDEKKWLEDAIVDAGEAAKEPLRDFIKNEEKLTYALHAYERICGADEAIRYFVEVLNHYGPEDHRSGEAKLQLVHALAEHASNPAVLPALMPFLLDHTDEVRTAVLEQLDLAADRKDVSDDLLASSGETLATLVCDPTVGPRVQRRACELLEKRVWAVGGSAQELAPFVNDEWFLDKKRFVRKRVKK